MNRNTTDVMTRLRIKRYLEFIIHDKLKCKVVDHVKTGATNDVYAWVKSIEESYAPVQLSTGRYKANLSVTIEVFSQRNESAVHAAILDLFNLTPADFSTVHQINSVDPSHSSTDYDEESTEGLVLGTITLDFTYFIKKA